MKIFVECKDVPGIGFGFMEGMHLKPIIIKPPDTVDCQDHRVV